MKTKIIILLLILLSFTPEKKYSVTLSVNDWQKYINYVEAAKSALKQSDLPSKYSFPLIDSLTKMQEEFKNQIVPQLPKDSTIKK